MRLLVDTHVVLWQLAGGRDLSAAARRAIADADDVLVSVVSFAEIGIKVAAGKLDVPPDLPAVIAASGLRTLGLSAAHGLAVGGLPVHHRDPFDRLIIAQALVERLTLLSADRRFGAYDVDLVMA